MNDWASWVAGLDGREVRREPMAFGDAWKAS